MKLRVGLSTLRGDLDRYASRFDAVELIAEEGRLPRASTLERYRARVPQEFVFSVVLPQKVAVLPAAVEVSPALGYAMKVAGMVRADWIVLRTPPSVTPSASMRRRLLDLAAAVRLPSCRVAWEPRGVWDVSEAETFAAEADLHVVRDGTREELPPSPVVYTRLRALGTATQVGAEALERLAARLVGREEAVVIVEGQGAGRVRPALEGILGELSELEAE